ncbi:MAG: hypothetical protein KA807_03825 [Prolixibacteraceae bacterium]|nr:hypothetical protein [Prolixibacteraceae bacterium]
MDLLIKLYSSGIVVDNHVDNNVWIINNHRMINSSDESENIELLCYLKPLADEYGYNGESYTRDEFDYIPETFPIVKRK